MSYRLSCGLYAIRSETFAYRNQGTSMRRKEFLARNKGYEADNVMVRAVQLQELSHS